jgi:hypothetical protein
MSPGKPVAVLGHAGDKKDPFPLTYPKPKNAYKPLYLGEKTDGIILTQAQIMAEYDNPKLRTQYEIKRYDPFPSVDQELPDGTEIGIRDPYDLTDSVLIGPLSAEGTTGGYLINDRLRKYGYDPSTEGMQGDHFIEMQYGGKNVLENLWPLETGLNNASGNYLKNLKVTTLAGKEKKVSELKRNVRDYWFMVTGFKRP